jgi:hypothetical protein
MQECKRAIQQSRLAMFHRPVIAFQKLHFWRPGSSPGERGQHMHRRLERLRYSTQLMG